MEIARVTVILEDTDGREHVTRLEAIPGLPLVSFEFNREPVIDHAAEAAAGGAWRMMKPGPYVGIKLEAYGASVEVDAPVARRRERPPGTP